MWRDARLEADFESTIIKVAADLFNISKDVLLNQVTLDGIVWTIYLRDSPWWWYWCAPRALAHACFFHADPRLTGESVHDWRERAWGG